jgi:hypothetical protein
MTHAAFSGRVLFQQHSVNPHHDTARGGLARCRPGRAKTIDQAATFVRQISDETNDQAYEPTSRNGVGNVRRE